MRPGRKPRRPVFSERGLHLEDILITRIPAPAFANLSALTNIFLTNDKIVDIGPNAFENLTNLKYIGLAGNQLSRLDNNSFANIPHLQRLNLHNNHIHSIADNTFNRTSKVEEIDLEYNHLSHIPPLGHQLHLRELNLQNNVIVNATFPTSFTTTAYGIGIDLSSNMIAAIHNATFHSIRDRNLTYLYLSDNKIENVDRDAFAELSSVTELRLKHNPLTVQALKNIAVSLSGRACMSLDVSGIFYTKEQVIQFLSLFRSVSLKHLKLRENHISALTNDMFINIGQLSKLDLGKNTIAYVQGNSFNGLKNLITLNLFDNALENVPNALPSSLQELYLNQTKISTIKRDTFMKLLDLRR